MVYIRGNKVDYERWERLTGDSKFGYENVLRLFKKSQSAQGYGSDEFNGRGGYLKTSRFAEGLPNKERINNINVTICTFSVLIYQIWNRNEILIK